MITKEDVYKLINKRTLNKILNQFELDIDGYHGFHHWARVIDNGIKIAEHYQLNKNIIIGFGLFHDIMRENDDDDPDHGFRGANFLEEIKNETNFTQDEIDIIKEAATTHTEGFNTDSLIIGACWDADRLDLYRVGIYPDIDFLSTEYAKNETLIEERSLLAEKEILPDWANELIDEVYYYYTPEPEKEINEISNKNKQKSKRKFKY